MAVASVATGHPKVNVLLPQERSYVNGEIWDDFQMQLGDVSQHVQLLWSRVILCQMHMAVIIQHGWKTRDVFVAYLLGTSCSLTDFIILC